MDFFKPYKRSETSVETHPIHPHTHYLASVATIYPWLIQVEIMQLKMGGEVEKLNENKFIESRVQVIIGSQRAPLKTDR